MMFSYDTPAEVMQKEFYKQAKEEAFVAAENNCKKSSKEYRECIIASLSFAGYLEEMKRDKELAITEFEYQYARKCAYKKVKDFGLLEYGININNPEDIDEAKEFLSDLGYADLVAKDTDFN